MEPLSIIKLDLLQAPWEIEGNRPDTDWPTEGKVKFKDYKVRYRPGLDLVLKGLSFIVNSGEKVMFYGNREDTRNLVQ